MFSFHDEVIFFLVFESANTQYPKPNTWIVLQLNFEPLTLNNWHLFETLMGERGGCGGCWCMTHRLKKSDFEKNKYEGNKKLFRQLVENNLPVGLLAIYEKEAIGWISLAPREQFIRLSESRIYKLIDEKEVWSIT